ncbi:beta-galactosidase trimerization domain-containing protein [Verminephrobacter eiseniae]|nr:beta-galactosidase trimerization domain-containing protein [Verminephrobacter eiseniae]
MGVICKDAWTQAIEAFARAGGTVIAGARTGTRDANRHVIRDTAPGRALPAPCGVEVQEFGLMPSSADGADIEGVPVGVERRTDRVHGTGALRRAAHGCAVIKPASAHA